MFFFVWMSTHEQLFSLMSTIFLEQATIVIFPPSGSLIYNQTDDAGWCFTAICSHSCIVVKQPMPCQTTIPSPTSSSSTLNAAASTMTTQQHSTVTASPTVSQHTHSPLVETTESETTTSGLDCNNVEPPRKVKCDTLKTVYLIKK